MRVFIIFCVFVVNYILQATVFPHIQILGVQPNTALVLVVSFAFLRDDIEGAFMGLFAGFLQDVFFARFIGYNMLCYALAGYLCGKPFKDYFRENYLFVVLLSVLSSFFYEFITYVTHYMLFGKVDTFFYFYRRILPSMAYTLVLVFPVYFIALKINARLEKRSERHVTP